MPAPPSKPEVRLLLPEEWKLYKTLRLRALKDSPTAFGTVYAEARRRSKKTWTDHLVGDPEKFTDLPLVAEVDGAAMGGSFGIIRAEEPEVAWLYQMWVDPRYRGQGVGAQLLQTTIDWARETSARCVNLNVTTTNEAAIRLYERFGFRVAGSPMPLRPGSRHRVEPMQLDLDEPAPPVTKS